MHIPSNWDISHPSESDAGKKSPWWPENKDIMIEVKNNAIMTQCLLHKIQDLKEILLDFIKESKRAPSPPPSPKRET